MSEVEVHLLPGEWCNMSKIEHLLPIHVNKALGGPELEEVTGAHKHEPRIETGDIRRSQYDNSSPACNAGHLTYESLVIDYMLDALHGDDSVKLLISEGESFVHVSENIIVS